MAERLIVTPALIRQLLDYDSEAGLLYWKPRGEELFTAKRFSASRACRSWNTRYAGKIAFSQVGTDGYPAGRVLGHQIAAHRVVWAWVYGVWPDVIDHQNHNRQDNRIANLRNISVAENRKNVRYNPPKSGKTSVHWRERHQRWSAKIGIGNKRSKSLGLYVDLVDAVAAREAAERELGYHTNHGCVQT